ncbi:MAG: extradiol dioxygenase [Alphaproteobacteria bacterium]|nr:extradiol dioxygenase [Alphaproteobacteria bacterium]
MKITGAHTVLYSKDAEADRAFLRDVLNFPNVDAGGGWLIFGLPPGEVAVHPGDEGTEQAFFLMVDDVEAFVAEMAKHGRPTVPLSTRRYGVMTSVTLPSGHELGVYQPRHVRPPVMDA